MDLFKVVNKDLMQIISKYLGEAYDQNDRLASNIKFNIPPVQTGCDYSTNVAMIYARVLKKSPMQVASEIVEQIQKLEYIKDAVAVNGFINMTFTNAMWEKFLAGINADKEHFGDGDPKEKVLLEFISANPTGPLHVGHCRGAILGLAISKLMKKAGYDVTKEYYINDYGVQIRTLVKSVQFRYEQCFGLHKDEQMPDGCYPGEYLVDYAKQLASESGNVYVGLSEDEFYGKLKKTIVNAMMDIIRADLKLLGLEYDSFVSETDIVEQGKIKKAIEYLSSMSATKTLEDGSVVNLPYIYKGKLDAPVGGSANEEEQEESKYSAEDQTLFRSTLFGDDKDRVVMRADGTTTYFASDIAYHKDKFDRGYTNLIDIFGADHGGYVKRITSAVDAVSNHKAKLKVVLCQMVALEKNGEPFKMSKRKGTFVLLSDVAKAINIDELKLFMLSKSPDTQMTFDLVKVKEKSKDNLVYYIQYAYARANSVLRNFKAKFGKDYVFNSADLDGLMENCPKPIKEIVVFMAKYPSIILSSAEKHAPNMIVDYLKELASLFHSLWSTDIKLVDTENEEKTKSMMAFVTCVKDVMANALACISINAPEKM